ncbi:choice-of-anchor J domain-containing protein [bacterium]|nr:choice-of-anchor J domain-containing protein [candidate division CSSED10-310 bacterium]
MKRWFCLWVLIMMMAILPVGASISHTVHFSAPGLTAWTADLDGDAVSERYVKIDMEGAPLMAHPGEPMVPHRPVTLLLPQNETMIDVSIVYDGWHRLPGIHRLAPGQHDYPLSRPQDTILTPPSPAIYGSNTPFPRESASIPRIFWSKGYQIVTVNLYPIRYLPADGQIEIARSAVVQIETIPADTRSDRVRCRGLASDREWVARKVDNPDMVSDYSAEPVPEAVQLHRDVAQYVIISNNTLINAGGPNNFQDFLAFKSTRGISGAIKPVEEIYTEYPGADNQQKIRAFCADAYAAWDTEYILIGGDHEIVPTRGCYATAEGHEDNTIPTDMYFGCLDGTWNDNGNTRYGEVDDGPGGTEPDVFTELFVGRCPADDINELHNFISKIIAYETDDYQADWADNALLLGEYLWPQTYGGDYMDELWYGSDLWGYSTPAYPDHWSIDNLYERENAWGSGDLVPLMNSNTFHWINHLGHANESTVMHLGTSNVSGLTNSRPFLVYSQGCYAGAFDTTDCIAEYFSWSAHGAFAVFMNGRYGWGEIGCTDGPGQYFHRQFHDALFTENIRELGRMNADSKEDNVWCMNYKANRWTCYEVNLLGCPQTPLLGRVTTRGQFTFDREAYADSGTIVASTLDVDLNQDPDAAETITVTMTTNGGDTESLLLTETGTNTCVFQGTIDVANGSASPGNGVVDALEAQIITGTYIDASDGFGGTNVPVTDTAVVDNTQPVISNVQVAFLDDTSAVITWTTDEPCSSTVLFDTPVNDEVSVDDLVTEHHVTLTNLAQCLDYIFSVRSADAAGNLTEDDNGGAFYSFTTMVRIYVLQEEMNTDPGWTITGGDWAFGQPTGQPSGPGADPTSGCDGPYVYGTNLNGAYAGGATPYHLVTPALDCSAAFGVRFSFYQWLAIDANDQDEAYISVSTDGASWTDIYMNPASNLYDYTWTRYEYDISSIADGQPTVYIRWTMGPAGTGTVGGWNIDNVEVSYAAPCNVPILIHDSHVIDDSAGGNGDGLINPLETIAIPVTLRNVGLDATGVSATLTTTHPGITISTPAAAFPDISQGGYGTSLTDFVFEVTENVVDGDAVPFTVNWTSDQTSATTMFMEEVVAPNLVYDGYGIMDAGGDGDGIFDPGETIQMTVTIQNAGRLAARSIIGSIESDHPEYITVQQGCASYPDVEPGQSGTTVDPYYTISASLSTPDHLMVTFTVDLQADGHHKQVEFDVEITTSTFTRRLLWDMDEDPGWTPEGQWEWGIPQGNSGDPSGGYTGAQVYGYNLAGAYANSMTETNLTTDAINCSNFTDVEIHFMRWLGIESSTYDHAAFTVSNDGTTWTTIWQHSGATFTDPDWQPMTYDISAVADGQATVYLRWVMGTTDGSVEYCGWNLDDVELWAASDNPQPVLTHAGHSIDDSAGNGDGMINPMESILMDVTAENVGIAGTGITAFLSTDNPHIAITQGETTFPDLPAGAQGQTETPFAFTVSADALNGETVNFIVTYFSATGNGSFMFTETIAGPDIAVHSITIVDSGDHDGVLDPGESAVIAVTLVNNGPMAVTGLTGVITGDAPAYFFIDDGTADFGDVPGGGTAGSLSPHFTVNAASFTPDPTGVVVTLNLTGNEATATVTFDIEITASNFLQRFFWDMDDDPGWTMEGAWEWGVPQGVSGDPSSGFTGSTILGYNLAGSYTNSLPETYVTAGPLDCSSLTNVEIRFMRWLGIESSSWDHASFRVSNDGTTWTTIWDHTGSSFTDPDWQALMYDISAVADGQSAVYLRWVMGATDSSVTYCGWNLDDVEIWADSAGNPCVHHGDVNFDGEVTSGDAQLTFMIALGMITPSYEEACAADCNGNDEITAGDAQQVFMTALGMTSCVDPMPDVTVRLRAPESVERYPVALYARQIEDRMMVVEIRITDGNQPIDAFTVTCALHPDFALTDCHIGPVDPGWVEFGCHENGDGTIRVGGYTDGQPAAHLSPEFRGVLAVLILDGPVRVLMEEAMAPIRIIGVADDLK